MHRAVMMAVDEQRRYKVANLAESAVTVGITTRRSAGAGWAGAVSHVPRRVLPKHGTARKITSQVDTRLLWPQRHLQSTVLAWFAHSHCHQERDRCVHLCSLCDQGYCLDRISSCPCIRQRPVCPIVAFLHGSPNRVRILHGGFIALMSAVSSASVKLIGYACILSNPMEAARRSHRGYPMHALQHW
jgi:hypothetical protein